MDKNPISTQTLRRLPVYLDHLRTVTTQTISATAIAAALGLSEIQVRKDLASISGGGRPGVGYDTETLIVDISHYLGYDRRVKAVLVGAGNLGRALAGYGGFARCGLDIAAAFDSDPDLNGGEVGRIKVYSMDALPRFCRKNRVQIGIITVPAKAAQEVCDSLAAGGVRAIWNFAPVHLSAPEGVMVQNENLVASLTVLSRRLTERLENDNN
jgi:redox-sensing transcriptional repressor